MSVFQKTEQRKKKEFPAFLLCSLAFCLLSLLFLLCFNQKEYMMEGEENDYLLGTITFFSVSVLSSFLDFAFFFSFSEENPIKKWFLLGSLSLEIVSYVVGLASYFRLYNETVSSIVATRIVIAALGFLLFLMSLISRLVTYFENFKKLKNNAKLLSTLEIMPFALTNVIALLFPVAVFQTMLVSYLHYCFVLLFVSLFSNVLLGLFLLFSLQIKKMDPKNISRISAYFSLASIVLSLTTLLAGIIAYSNKDGLAFRSFYWLIASLIFCLLIDGLYFVYRYLSKNSQKLSSLEDEKE